MKQHYMSPRCRVVCLSPSAHCFLTTSPGLSDVGYDPNKGSEAKELDDFFEDVAWLDPFTEAL